MNIIYKKIEELKPYEKNAKKHDETQIKNVANSIEKFGFVQPLVIDKNNVIVIGHCRYEASKLLKLRELPCLLVDNLTENQIKALRIADNKTNERSIWDLKELGEELKELELEFDFTELGFTEFELSAFDDEAVPEGYDKDLIDQYEQGDDFLEKERVIITYYPEQAEKLKEILGVEKLKVNMSIEDLKIVDEEN